jgi:hypothetical protein
MRKKQIKCYLCGNVVLYDDLNQNYTCSECNATHDSGVFEAEKIKSRRYSLRRIRILIAILGALFVFYYILRIFI